MSERQGIVIENNGCPEIATTIENIEFCIPNNKEKKKDEYNQMVTVCYRYRIKINDTGFAELECMGEYQ